MSNDHNSADPPGRLDAKKADAGSLKQDGSWQPVRRKRRARVNAKWLTTVAFALAFGGTCIEYDRLADTTNGDAVGYEASHWAVEYRFGRITLYSWYKAVSRQTFVQCPPPTGPAAYQTWAAAYDAWVSALPERLAGRGWYSLTKAALESSSTVSDTVMFMWRPGQGQPVRYTYGWNSPPLERGFAHVVNLAWGGVALLGVATVFYWVRDWRRRRGRSHDHTPIPCVSCGYDLTGNTSGVCSECGKPIPTKMTLPPSADA